MFLTPLFFQCQAAMLTDLSPKCNVDKKVTKKRWNAAKIGLVAKIAKAKALFQTKLLLCKIKLGGDKISLQGLYYLSELPPL